ncbi:MAG: hypothetical protein JWN43_3368 [Gammaproteobacteria bacterium]|nr:hypothetical protein [Gammaproteobacteria bacterium]
MARPAGLEPTTTGLEGRCSIQLSYGRTNEAVGEAKVDCQPRIVIDSADTRKMGSTRSWCSRVHEPAAGAPGERRD